MTTIINVESDVPVPKPQATVHGTISARLKAMKPGDSFFLEGRTELDTVALVKYGERSGIHLLALNTDEDSVYLVPGVRVWRQSKADYDRFMSELFHQTEPGGSATPTIKDEVPGMPGGVAGLPPEAAGPIVKTKRKGAEAKAKAAGKELTYYMLGRGDGSTPNVWSSTLPLAEQGIDPEAQKLAVTITAEQYEAIASGVQTPSPTAEPGPAATGTMISLDGIVWFQRIDGECIKMASDKLTNAMIAQFEKEGTKRISKEEYDAWDAEQL